jgi:DNA-binding NtrC family response regulator
MKKLSSWHWPGNIRELENFIERSLILTHGSELQVPISRLSNNGKSVPMAGTREANERGQIVRILKDDQWASRRPRWGSRPHESQTYDTNRLHEKAGHRSEPSIVGFDRCRQPPAPHRCPVPRARTEPELIDAITESHANGQRTNMATLQ